jgi:hypothetical protein
MLEGSHPLSEEISESGSWTSQLPEMENVGRMTAWKFIAVM